MYISITLRLMFMPAVAKIIKFNFFSLIMSKPNCVMIIIIKMNNL